MDESQQDTICKLKFLGRVGKGEKINVKDLTLQPDGWVTTVKRTLWTVDNRNSTMSFIQTTIQGAFNLILSLNKSEHLGNRQLAQSMIGDIENARSGISNLKTTYSDDTYFCCGIDTYIETIVARLSEMKTKHPDLFASTDDEDDNHLHSD